MLKILAGVPYPCKQRSFRLQFLPRHEEFASVKANDHPTIPAIGVYTY
jgi:hypothetical protein